MGVEAGVEMEGRVGGVGSKDPKEVRIWPQMWPIRINKIKWIGRKEGILNHVNESLDSNPIESNLANHLNRELLYHFHNQKHHEYFGICILLYFYETYSD